VAVLQNELELAVRNGFKLKDAIYVNDRGSMNADESHRIEMAGSLVKCGSVEQIFTGDMQIHISRVSVHRIRGVTRPQDHH
jgi:hypothetical protein